MKKRIFALCMAACMATSLAGCKSEPEEKPTQDPAATETVETQKPVKEDTAQKNENSLVIGKSIEQEDYTMTPVYCRTTDVVHCMHQASDYASQSSGSETTYVDLLMKFSLKKRVELDIYHPFRHELIFATAEDSRGEKYATDTENKDDLHLLEVEEEDFLNQEYAMGWNLNPQDYMDDYSPEKYHPIDDYYLHYIVETDLASDFVDFVFHGDDGDYSYHYELDHPEFATGYLEKDVPVTAESGLTVTYLEKGYATEALLTSTGEKSTFGDPETFGDSFYYAKFKVDNDTMREIDLKKYSSVATSFFFNGTDYIEGTASLAATETADHKDILPDWKNFNEDMDTIKPGETGYLYAFFFAEDEYRDIPEFSLDIAILEDVFHVEA